MKHDYLAIFDTLSYAERVALVTLWLRDGERLDTNTVARTLCMSRSAAYRLLASLCRVLSLTYDYETRTWYLVSGE